MTLLRHPRAPLVGMLLLLAAAYAAPRAVVFRGIPYTAQLVFGDMPLHLLNLEKDLKTWTLGYTPKNSPYFLEHPNDLRRHNDTRWPPGVYRVSLPMARWLGPLSIWTTQVTNLLFHGVLVFGLFLLGRRLQGPRLGLWAALLATLCPALAGATWYLTLDFPLTAMVTLCLALLLETDRFTRRWRTLLFAAASAAALYTKLSFPLYLLAPCLVCLIRGLRRPGDRGRAGVLLNVGLGLGLVALLSILLGNFELGAFWEQMRYHAVHDTADEALPEFMPAAWTVQWAVAVGRMAVNSYTLPLALLALPGLVMLLVRRGGPLPHRWVLLAFLAGSYLTFTLISAKLERYVQPLYPLLCLLTAWWILRWAPRRWRLVGLTWAATVFAAVLVLAHLHPLPWLTRDPPRFQVDRPIFYDNRPPTAAELDGLRRLRFHPTCDLRPVMAAMKELTASLPPRGPLSVAFLETPKDEVAGEPTLTYDTLASIAAQLFPRRIVLNTPLHPGRPPAPYTLLLHRPSVKPATIAPQTRLRASRRLQVRCARTHEMTLTLLEAPHP